MDARGWMNMSALADFSLFNWAISGSGDVHGSGWNFKI